MAEITVDADMSDSALARALGKALRTGDPVTIAGDLAAGLGAGATGWITALARARVPVTVRLSGRIGARGIAITLLADGAQAEKAEAEELAHRTPLVAAIAAKRLGQVGARRFLSHPSPLDALGDCGLLNGPAAADVAGLKPVLVAAAELPFEDAIGFAAAATTHEEHHK